jgi:processive 1,2-diacylglycerol beta-glucosyltransferase
MPRLLMSHHLVVAKAGGAMVQEAIAARCPIIINQVIPGQEEGNARLVRKLGVGAVAENSRELRDMVEEAFAHKSRQWQEWRDNLEKVSRADAALRVPGQQRLPQAQTHLLLEDLASMREGS